LVGKVRKVPQRTCVGCRSVKDKKELIRIVRTPEGSVLVDLKGKMSGRGAYICPNVDCLNQSIKGQRLQKALQTEVDEAVYEALKEQICKV
jgi:predicted RNA-binding protein YlxR (DUF448 family)